MFAFSFLLRFQSENVNFRMKTRRALSIITCLSVLLTAINAQYQINNQNQNPYQQYGQQGQNTNTNANTHTGFGVSFQKFIKKGKRLVIANISILVKFQKDTFLFNFSEILQLFSPNHNRLEMQMPTHGVLDLPQTLRINCNPDIRTIKTEECSIIRL